MYHFHSDIQRLAIQCSEYPEEKPNDIAYGWCLKGINPSGFEKFWMSRRDVGKLVEADQTKLCAVFR